MTEQVRVPKATRVSADVTTGSTRGRKRWLLTIVQIAITTALLWWIFHDPTLRSKMAATLRRTDPAWFIAGIALAGIELFACAFRWRLFLRIQGIEIGFVRVVRIYLFAMFLGLFLPGAVSGDAVRTVYAMRAHPDRKTGAVLSIMMDHLSGLLALLVAAGIFTFSHSDRFTRSPVVAAALYVLLAFVCVTVGGLALAFWLTTTGRARRMPRHWPGAGWLIELSDALSLFICHWKTTLLAMAVSFVTLGAYFTIFYCSSRAIHAGCSLTTIFSVMPIVDVATALPLTISGLGVRETLFQTLLHTLADIPANVAVLISLGGFFCNVVWSLAGAVVFALYRPVHPPPGRQAARDPVANAEMRAGPSTW